MADQNMGQEYGQDNEQPRRGIHPISGEPENRRNPGHEINQAGSDPANRRADGSRNRKDRPEILGTPEDADEERGPENSLENEPKRIPNNRTQAEERKDAWG